jgi:co-chaperonin GroES (HSP10)
MSSHLEPANDHLLVVDSPRETTLDGITLPDNVRQQEMCFGTVVFVGPKAEDTKPEDVVCYGPYAGKTVVLDGIEFRLVREGQIEAYVRKS